MEGTSDPKGNAMPKCGCTGTRTCGICEKDKAGSGADSYSQKPLVTVYDVVHQGADEKLSSCAFPTPCAPAADGTGAAVGGLLRLVLCGGCGQLFRLEVEDYTKTLLPPISRCQEHTSKGTDDGEKGPSVMWVPSPSNIQPPEGLSIVPNFLTELEEASILDALDTEPQENGRGWKESQSGRRKQDFGPQANFKKRKVKLGPLDDPGWIGVHPEYSVLQVKIPTLAPLGGQCPFQVAQWSALDYSPNSGSNLDPHVDDSWIWGGRILGVSMASSCTMSFLTAQTKDGAVVEVQAVLPQRSLFIMQGPARSQWLHGIRAGSIESRRISITIRELEHNFAKQFPELSADVVKRVNSIRAFAPPEGKD